MDLTLLLLFILKILKSCLKIPLPLPLSKFERDDQIGQCQLVVGGDTFEDAGKRARLDRVMHGNNLVMLASGLGCHTDVCPLCLVGQ